jgi:4-hydroxybenzoate polyprenyltransferase
MLTGRVTAMAAHTDIIADGWVARLPTGWRPYVLLARLDRPIGAWLLFLPGMWGILLARPTPAEALRLIVLFGIGAVVMRSAGCVVNDLWDRDIDRKVARTAGRPLAAGALRPRQALLFLVVLLVLGLAILLQLNMLSWALGAGSLVLVGLYPLAKRVTWWPQLMMGFTFGFGAPLGYVAGAGRIDTAWAALYGAAILWDLGFDTIYAHQDREDDALVGIGSTARLFGERTAPFLAACYGGTIALLALAGYLAGLSP